MYVQRLDCMARTSVTANPMPLPPTSWAGEGKDVTLASLDVETSSAKTLHHGAGRKALSAARPTFANL